MRQHKTATIVASALILLAFPLFLQSFGSAWGRIADMALLYVLLALGLNVVVGYAGLLDLGMWRSTWLGHTATRCCPRPT